MVIDAPRQLHWRSWGSPIPPSPWPMDGLCHLLPAAEVALGTVCSALHWLGNAVQVRIRHKSVRTSRHFNLKTTLLLLLGPPSNVLCVGSILSFSICGKVFIVSLVGKRLSNIHLLCRRETCELCSALDSEMRWLLAIIGCMYGRFQFCTCRTA